MRFVSKHVATALASLVVLALGTPSARAFCYGHLEVVAKQKVSDSGCPTPKLSKAVHFKCIDACGYETGPFSQSIVGFGECFKGEHCQDEASITCLPLEGQEVHNFHDASLSFSIVHREGYYELPPCLLPACRNNGVVTATADCPCQDSNDFQLRSCANDPIIVSLGDSRYELTGRSEGVLFDLNADGTSEQVPWTSSTGDEAFLVLDRNGNGFIDDGTELFGDSSPQHSSESPNGFLALAVYDDELNGGLEDNKIDQSDAVYEQLRLWVDDDHDGFSSPDELLTLPSVGLVSIHLDYRESYRRDAHGNQFRYWALTEWSSGTSRPVWDIFLNAD